MSSTRAPIGPRRLPRAVAIVLVLVAATVVLAPGLGAPARAQTSDAPVTPFPRPIIGFVPADQVAAATAIDPSLAAQSVAIAPGDGIGADTDRSVTVSFASPLTLPAGEYRASVVFGDPGGAQTRASFTSTDGVPGGGTVESSTDGRRWTAGGATDAQLEADSLRITAPVGSAAPGQGLWVQVQIGTDPARLSETPVLSLDALLGRHVDGALPSTTAGTLSPAPEPIAPGAQAEPAVIAGPPPTLGVDRQHITVTQVAPVPAKVANQPVTDVIDEVTFMPGYTPQGTIPAVVQIDRTKGTITALAGTSGLPADRTGDGSFIVEGVPTGTANPAGPTATVLDLAAVAEALDLPLDADGLGIGLRRKLTLADGRSVVGQPTVATLGWYQAASPIAASQSAITATPTTESTSTDVSSAGGNGIFIIGALVVALLALVVGLFVRHRRRAGSVDRWLDSYTPEEPADSTEAATIAAARVHSASVSGPSLEAPATPAPSEPATPPVPEPRAEPEPKAELAEPEALATAAELQAEPDASDDVDEPDDLDRPDEPDDHRRSPEDALAFFEAEVTALSDRVDRLPDPHAEHPHTGDPHGNDSHGDDPPGPAAGRST